MLDDIHRINPLPFKEEGGNIFGGTLGIFILLKGFSSGAVALTGVEAISNGVPGVPPARVEERGHHARVDGR